MNLYRENTRRYGRDNMYWRPGLFVPLRKRNRTPYIGIDLKALDALTPLWFVLGSIFRFRHRLDEWEAFS